LKLPNIYVPGPYRSASIGGRLLRVPDAKDREKQRDLYGQVKDVKPVSWKPEIIEHRIRAAFQANPHFVALRTDVQNCFDSMPQALVRSKIRQLPIAGDLKQSLENVLSPTPHGLPTGSPLSPWLAELVLGDLDQAMVAFPHYFRYADDVCIIGERTNCETALALIAKTLRGMGMAIHPEKSRIVGQAELNFLGRSYRQLDDSLLIEVDLGGDSFHLPNQRQLILRVNRTGQPYTEETLAVNQSRSGKGRRITYNVSCLLNRMSQQPTPFILEMLMLKPTCEDQALQQIIAEPARILDSGTPHALHGGIHRHYRFQVRARMEQAGPLPIGAAGEVYRWLHLTNTIMRTGQLPENYRELEGEWEELGDGLRRGDYAPYHARIKTLFKEEYALRNGPSILPANKPAIEFAAI
jgi:hypothetical protein